MSQSPARLARLVRLHNQLADWQMQAIAGFTHALDSCDTQMAQTLQAMDLQQNLGLAKGPNFSKTLQEIARRRQRLNQAREAARAEHARIKAIITKLEERSVALKEEIEAEALAIALDEWSNATATNS